MNRSNLTQANLDNLKKLFPDNPEIQNITVSQLLTYSEGKDLTGNEVETVNSGRLSKNIPRELPLPSACQMAVADVVIDCLFVLSGVIGLKGKISLESIQEVARIVEPELSKIEHIASVLRKADSSKLDKAKAMFRIGSLIYSGGMLEAVVRAVVHSLSAVDAALYGTLAIAELAAAFLTDGAAIVAEIAIEVANIGFLASDSFKVKNECGEATNIDKHIIQSSDMVSFDFIMHVPEEEDVYLAIGTSGQNLMLWSTRSKNEFTNRTGIFSRFGFIIEMQNPGPLKSGAPLKLKIKPTSSMDTMNIYRQNMPFVKAEEVLTSIQFDLIAKIGDEQYIHDGDRITISPADNVELKIGWDTKMLLRKNDPLVLTIRKFQPKP